MSLTGHPVGAAICTLLPYLEECCGWDIMHILHIIVAVLQSSQERREAKVSSFVQTNKKVMITQKKPN